MGKVTLVRPDGSTFNVDANDAGKYAVLGYKPADTGRLLNDAVAASTEDYYSTPGQKLLTGIEGAASGLTLGLTDLGLEAAGADTDMRAQYNPGVRMASEIAGSLLPLTPGLGVLKSATPAGLLMRGGEAAAEGLAARGLGRAVQRGVQGAIEGAGFGAGGALADAAVNHDPLTVESIGAGIGFGALFGGGISALGGAALGKLESREAARAAAEAQEVANREAFTSFRGAITDLSESVNAAVKATDNISGAVKAAGKVSTDFLKPLDLSGANYGALRDARAFALKAFNGMKVAAAAGDEVELKAWQEAFQRSVNEIAEGAGAKAPELAPYIANTAKYSIAAAEEAAKFSASAGTLKSFPTTPDEFARMTSERADKLFGAVDTVLSGKSAEMAGVREATKDAIKMLGEKTGVIVDGAPATQLRGIYEAVRGATKEVVAEGKLPWALNSMKRGAEYAGGHMLSRAAGEAGAGSVGKTVAYEAGKKLISGLLSIKAGVAGALSSSVDLWAPKALKAGSKALPLIGPRTEMLRERLDGGTDRGKLSAAELMELRAKEIRDAAPGVRDVLYKNLQGLAMNHPDLAAALHADSVKRFSWILDKLPRDPGLAYSRMNSLWKPDPVQTEKFARYYEVFQNPVSVVNTVLKSGRVLPEWAEGLREMYPALWTELRVGMLNRLADPKVLGKLSYPEQVSLGTLLQIPMHSTLTPQFVVQQQEMYMQRNQPLGIPPQPGMDSGGGRPPGPANDPRSSPAQKIGEH